MRAEAVSADAPLCSVIMPAYRCEDVIAQSVASVQRQSEPNWELLIVDDCSPDGTYEKALRLAADDPRIRVFRTTGNAGPAAARNTALDNARGRYAAFLDSDDLWLPEKLSRQIAFMRGKKAAFSCTAYDRVREDGTVINRVTPFEKADYDKVLYYANPVGNSTAMIDRQVLGDLRAPLIRKRNDFALWLRALKKTDYVYGMGECLAQYRVRVSSVSSNKLDLIRYQWQLYREVEKLSLGKSALAFAGLAYTKLTHPTWHGAGRKDL